MENLFVKVLEQTRQPVFYRKLAVPDSLDGRFDLLCLNCHLVVRRLKKIESPAAESFAQQFIDRLCTEFERTARDIGVSDVSVGKHVKRMTEAYYGRAEAYEAALVQEGNDELVAALSRNIYAQGAVDEQIEQAKALALFVRTFVDDLNGQSEDKVLEGQVEFLLPQ